MKCKPKNPTFDCIQWNWNFEEIYNFCNKKINWLDKQNGTLILYGDWEEQDNQIIKLNDYIIRRNNVNFDVLDIEHFNIMYDVV